MWQVYSVAFQISDFISSVKCQTCETWQQTSRRRFSFDDISDYIATNLWWTSLLKSIEAWTIPWNPSVSTKPFYKKNPFWQMTKTQKDFVVMRHALSSLSVLFDNRGSFLSLPQTVSTHISITRTFLFYIIINSSHLISGISNDLAK